MSFDIYEPRIHLFAFSNKENFDTSNKFYKTWIWHKCNKIVSTITRQNFNILEQINLDTSNTNLIKYFPANDIYHPHFFDQNNNHIPNHLNPNKNLILQHKNYNSIYAIQDDENYGLGLNLNHPTLANQKVEVSQLRFFNPDNILILGNEEDDKKNFVEQTLLITARIPEEDRDKTDRELKNIANECIRALFQNHTNNQRNRYYNYYRLNNGMKKLFNSPIFEYGSLERNNISLYKNIFVWLFYDEQERDKFYKNYNHFLDLFYYRAKITSELKKIRHQEKLIRQDLKEINDQIDSVNYHIKNNKATHKELSFLKNKLIILPKMAREYGKKVGRIFDLEFRTVIEDNMSFYNDELIDLVHKKVLNEKEFQYLIKFTEKACNKFLDKATATIKYFEYSSTRTDSAIASVRGQIAIEQTELEIQRQEQEKESQYKQEITILAIGSGIAAGEIFASSYSLIADENPLNSLIHPFFLSIAFSLLWGSFVAIFIWTIPKVWRSRKTKSKTKSSNKK